MIAPADQKDCLPGLGTSCADLRGSLYNSTASTTWTDIGTYNLDMEPEWALGYDANTSIGYDNVTFGLPGGAALSHQMIAGYAALNFFIGMIGLSPHAVNLSDIKHPQPGVLTSLRDQDKDPSLSWAYTAGSHNVQPTSFGSLVFGGYDANHFVPNNFSFPFSPDSTKDLFIGMQSLSSNLSHMSLLTGSVYAFIDSSVAEIWLPEEACRAFESVFGNNYNMTTEHYTINGTTHQTLLKRNPRLTFKLGHSALDGPSISIIRPYSSLLPLTNLAPLRMRLAPLLPAETSSQRQPDHTRARIPTGRLRDCRL